MEALRFSTQCEYIENVANHCCECARKHFVKCIVMLSITDAICSVLRSANERTAWMTAFKAARYQYWVHGGKLK